MLFEVATFASQRVRRGFFAAGETQAEDVAPLRRLRDRLARALHLQQAYGLTLAADAVEDTPGVARILLERDGPEAFELALEKHVRPFCADHGLDHAPQPSDHVLARLKAGADISSLKAGEIVNSVEETWC